MKNKGLRVVLFATLALSLNAVPCTEGQCEETESADTSTLLQSRVNVHEAAAAKKTDTAPTYTIAHHHQVGSAQETGICPGGWTTGKPVGAGVTTKSMGKKDSEDHCVQAVNDNHPTANAATACMHNHCGGLRECFAVFGATGTEISYANSNEIIHQETCFFQPAAMLAQIANGEMTSDMSLNGEMGEESAFTFQAESEIDDVADEVEKGHHSTEDSQTVEVKDACDPCDAACVEKTSQESFAMCDADKNNKLSVKEIQDCTLDETGKGPPMGVSLGEVVSDAKAREIMAFYDEDKDDELTPDEWLKAEVPCEASLRQEGTVVSEETVVAKCVSKIVSKVFKRENFKCKKTTKSKHCSLLQTEQQEQGKATEEGEGATEEGEGAVAATTKDAMESRWGGRRRRRWGGGRRRWFRAVVRALVCVWKTIVTWVNCVRDVIVNIVKSAAAGFRDCWNNVRAAVAGAYMELIKACHSVDSCLSHLLKGPKALWDKIVELAKKGVKALNKGPIGKAVAYIHKVMKKAPGVARKVGKAFGDAGKAVVKMVVGTGKAIAEYGKGMNFCTTRGMGYWSFKPTDCGAFGRMKEIFKLHNLHKIPSIFGDVVARFGRCVIKLGMLSLPSPFLDVKVNSFCVPHWLQVPIKGIVGTFRYLIAQITAAANGCSGSHANQPVCVLVSDLKKVAATIKDAFASSLMQQTTQILSNYSKNGDVYTSDCAGSDFSISIKLYAKFSFPPPIESSISVGFTFAQGCMHKKYFAQLLFGISGSLFIAGYDTGPIETGEGCVALDLGFGIGTPSNNVVQWKGAFTIGGKATILGVKVGFGLSFKVLPDPAWPTGLSATFKLGVLYLQMKEKEKEFSIKDAIAKESTVDAQLHAGVGALIGQIKDLDFKQMAEERGAEMMMQMRRGANALSGGDDVEAPIIIPEEAGLTAGLGFDACLTCGASGGGTAATAAASGGSTGAGAVGTAASTQGNNPEWVNLRGKPTSQVSTGWGGPSSKAVDGNWATNYPSRSCTHTHRHHGAWWSVDLGSNYQISKIKIANRGDCCGHRLNGFSVYVDGHRCAHNVGISQGQHKEVGCSATGSSVKVQLGKSDYLTICEVGVYGVKMGGGWMNLRGKGTSQASTGWGGPSSKAVDGNWATNYPSRSCTHTHRHHGSWWQVDLGKSVAISKIKIANRGDCCGHRLNGFNVYVDGHRCAHNVGISQGQTKVVPCSRTGRRVKVALGKSDYLTICEFSVFDGNAFLQANATLAEDDSSDHENDGAILDQDITEDPEEESLYEIQEEDLPTD